MATDQEILGPALAPVTVATRKTMRFDGNIEPFQKNPIFKNVPVDLKIYKNDSLYDTVSITTDYKRYIIDYSFKEPGDYECKVYVGDDVSNPATLHVYNDLDSIDINADKDTLTPGDSLILTSNVLCKDGIGALGETVEFYNVDKKLYESGTQNIDSPYTTWDIPEGIKKFTLTAIINSDVNPVHVITNGGTTNLFQLGSIQAEEQIKIVYDGTYLYGYRDPGVSIDHIFKERAQDLTKIGLGGSSSYTIRDLKIIGDEFLGTAITEDKKLLKSVKSTNISSETKIDDNPIEIGDEITYTISNISGTINTANYRSNGSMGGFPLTLYAKEGSVVKQVYTSERVEYYFDGELKTVDVTPVQNVIGFGFLPDSGSCTISDYTHKKHVENAGIATFEYFYEKDTNNLNIKATHENISSNIVRVFYDSMCSKSGHWTSNNGATLSIDEYSPNGWKYGQSNKYTLMVCDFIPSIPYELNFEIKDKGMDYDCGVFITDVDLINMMGGNNTIHLRNGTGSVVIKDSVIGYYTVKVYSDHFEVYKDGQYIGKNYLSSNNHNVSLESGIQTGRWVQIKDIIIREI